MMGTRAYIGAKMTGRYWLALLLSLLLGVLSSVARADFRQPGEPYDLVGPVVISVPSVQTEKIFAFTTPKDVLGPFTLTVQNGVGATNAPVTEGTIWLDNIQIAGPNDFRADVSEFTRNVDAGPGAHTLRVALQGASGSGIKLTLNGRKLLPVPANATPSPLQVAKGGTAQLDVDIYPAPDKKGKLQLSASKGILSVPVHVDYAAGQTRVQVPVKGLKVGAGVVQPKLRGRTIEVPVNVIPADAKLASLAPPLATLGIGGSATVTVELQSALPTPAYVKLSSSPAGLISHPATVTVPANTPGASFTIQGNSVGSGQLTASLNGTQATNQFTVLSQAVAVASLLPATSQIAATTTQNLTLSLTESVSAATAVNLSAQPAGIVAVPASVTVPAGTNQAQVPVQGQSLGTATVRAEYYGSSAEAVVQVTSPPVEIVSLEPLSLDIYNDAEASFTLTLNSAQPEAVEIQLTADPSGIVDMPVAVTVPAGASQISFQVQALAFGQAQVTATLNGKSKTATVNVIPHPLALVSLQPAQLSLQQGAAGSLVLNVNATQPQATAIPLSANPAGIVQVPASVLLPAGQTSVAVPVTGLAEGVANIGAVYNGTAVSAEVTVTPPPPTVKEIAPASASTPKGRPVTLMVKLDRVPNSPQVVALASSTPSVASVPTSVTVPAGASGADFAVTASEVGQAEISATLNGATAYAGVSVTPAVVVAVAISPIEHTAYIGDRVPYTAYGTFTDASQRDVSNEAQWSSSNETVATISVTGMADTYAAGSAQIGAAIDEASQQTGLSVLTPPALSLSASKTTLKEDESANVTVTSAEPAPDSGLEISFTGGGIGSLQLPLNVSIPAGQSSASFTVTGQRIGQYNLTANAPRRASASLDFNILSGMEITGIAPASGEPGSLVEIQGKYFEPVPSANAVAFYGNAQATVVEASSTRLRVKVPPTAQTGGIALTTPRGTVVSPVFTVIRQQDFAITASPSSQVLLTSGQAVFGLSLSSLGVQNFTGLASLNALGLPPGVTAKFSPTNLALNQPGSLILTAAPGAQIGNAIVTIEATALVSGVPQTRIAQVQANVQTAAGITGVKGRFVTPEGLGIAGVRVNVDANQTVSDAAGNFMLVNLPSGKVTLRFDATPAHPLYPIWPVIMELEAGKLTVLPDWPINPPPADDKFTAISNASQDQIITDPRFPGVEVKLPAGVSITGWDGVKKSRLAVERIEASKLPVPMPPIPTKEHYQLYFGTPMGGIPDQPIPVSVPNTTGLGPGEKTEIWYFDGSPMYGAGEWKMAGTATVSADGTQVVNDPGQGIPRFCGVCGLFSAKCPALPEGKPCPTCPTKSGNPVELFNGYEKPNLGGLSCSGIVPVEVGLSYNPVDLYQGRSGLEGIFGQGWFSDYEITLATSNQVPGSKRLILPGGSRINFALQSNGTYITKEDPRFQGGILKKAGSIWELSHKDGTLWRFGMVDEIGVTAAFLTEIRDPQGNSKLINRRSDYKITSIGTAERAHTYSYGANNLVERISDPAGREMRFTYNTQRRIETVTDPDGGVTRYTYVGDNEYPASPVCSQGTDGLRIKTIQYPGIDIPTENFHSTSRRVLRQTSRLGETRFAYTLTGACITHVNTPSQKCTANCPTEDSWENFQAGWRFHGGHTVATRVTEPSGKETLYRFNAQGVVLEKIDVDGAQSRKLLNAQNRVIQETDLLGRITKYDYDAQGNVTRETDPLGRVTETLYDAKWNLPASIIRYLDDATPVTTQTQYHSTLGKPVQVIDAENRATTLAYTPRGELERITDPMGHSTQLAYNLAGDLTETRDPLGNVSRMEADGAGRTIRTTTPKGYDWLQSFNGKSRPRINTDPTGGKIEQVYDDAGRLISIWDQNGNPVERYAYDERGNLISKTDADNRSETYQYDEANRLIQTTTRKGEVITYAYDLQDRLIQVSRPDGATTYGYDAAGRLIQVSEGSIRLQYEYDLADRLTREIQDTPAGFNSIEYQYDSLDRRISRKVNGGDETSYAYNKAGQITQIQYRGETTSYDYDPAGRLIQKTLPGGITQAYQYDAARRLTQVQYRESDTTLIDQLDLSYDAEGNITGKKLANSNLGLDTAMTAQFDAANRMTSITVNGKTYALTYDANGNLTSKQNTADPLDRSLYTWDARNRLAQLSSPGVDASFAYDPLGRRVQRTVNGVTTAYLYDGNQAIGEVRAGQAAMLLTGLAIDEAIARYVPSGRLTQLIDQLGSVIRQINEAGQAQSVTSYSPYGEAATTGDDLGNSTEYTGRENDGTGLYFYRARYYDPVLKIWTSEDPIGIAGGINLYAYVSANPINKTDPLGLAPEFCGSCSFGDTACLLRNGNLCDPGYNPKPPPPPLPKESKECLKCIYDKVFECQGYFSEGLVPMGGGLSACTLPPAMKRWEEACKEVCKKCP